MPVAVSMINMKGGVGKTTLAFNLAWFASFRRAKKVLVIDLDPQSNASQYLMGAKDYLNHIRANRGTVVDILEQFTPPMRGRPSPSSVKASDVITKVKKISNGGEIDLIPSRLELAWTLKILLQKIICWQNFLRRTQRTMILFLSIVLRQSLS